METPVFFLKTLMESSDSDDDVGFDVWF